MGSPRSEKSTASKCFECNHKDNKRCFEPCFSCTSNVVCMSDNFEPAEPVVLSASLMRVKMAICPDIFEGVKQIDDYGEAMHQNGRLERDLELKGIISLFSQYSIYNAVFSDSEAGRHIAAELQNLKPLNKD